MGKQQLTLMAGSNDGTAGLFALAQNSENFQARHVFNNGHGGVIRDWGSLASSGMYITAGEDARLCEWNTKKTDATPTLHLPTPEDCGRGKRRTEAISPPERVQSRQRLKHGE